MIDLLKDAGALLAQWRQIDCTATRTAGVVTTRLSFAPPSSGSLAWTATACAQRALEAIKQVKWTPAWGEERISNMIATRPDWCISRQRAWGVPIIVFYCEGCAEPLTDRKILDRIVGLIREQTADVWYSQSAEERVGRCRERASARSAAGHRLPQRKRYSRRSGSIPAASHRAVLTEGQPPALAGRHVSGGRAHQYRGWFQLPRC